MFLECTRAVASRPRSISELHEALSLPRRFENIPLGARWRALSVYKPAGRRVVKQIKRKRSKRTLLKLTTNSKTASKMSLLPFVLGYERPHRLIDQEFGLPLTPEDLLTAAMEPMLSRNYYRPWRQMAMASRDIGSTIKSDKEKFQVNLDVQHFAPEDITVKTVDGHVVIEGKHEEKKDDHGYVSRQFTRRYALPEGCNPETVESKLSSDGVLTVVAPRVASALNNERSVPISQTGPVRKEIKDQTSQANGSEK